MDAYIKFICNGFWPIDLWNLLHNKRLERKMKPVGKWIVAKSLIGGEKKTSAGIIFQEKSKSKIIPAKVISVGSRVTEDIKIDDIIWWDVTKIKDGYNGNHIVHQDWVEMVER